MKIVGISACTAGIAHTYMAQEALEQECKKRGIDCKIETQGGMGIDNELSQEEVDAADVVILAVAVSVEMADRFDAKRAAGRVIEVSPTEAIKQTAALIDRAENVAASAPQETHTSDTRSASPAPEGKTSLGAELFRYFNTGISYFLPVIIAGGMMFSFTLITGTVEDETKTRRDKGIIPAAHKSTSVRSDILRTEVLFLGLYVHISRRSHSASGDGASVSHRSAQDISFPVSHVSLSRVVAVRREKESVGWMFIYL